MKRTYLSRRISNFHNQRGGGGLRNLDDGGVEKGGCARRLWDSGAQTFMRGGDVLGLDDGGNVVELDY